MIVYRAAMHLARAVAWPVLWWLGRRVPAFRERWDERRGRSAWPVAARGGIVVHAASMGEVGAALPLLQALRTARPELPLTLTCTSPTASARIRDLFGDTVHHAYLPFDTTGAVRRFLGALAPRALVVMETELWPVLLTEAQRRGTVVVLANGRLSERSAARYARFGGLTRELLAALDLLAVQDEAARERFLRLGAAPARCVVTGSLKFETPLSTGHEAQVARFRAWTGGRPLWVAASTHEGEEAAVLEAQRHDPSRLLVLVPRHPQRFEAVATLLRERGVALQRRSEDRAVDPATSVLLVDAMGELTAWMALAEAVFIGGTLVPVGGHNPLEAMQFGVPLIAGPQRFNFAEVFEALEDEHAVTAVQGADDLARVLATWRTDPAAALAAGARGRALHMRHAGATARTLSPLLGLLDRRAARAEACVGAATVWSDPALLAPAEADFDRGDPFAAGSGRGVARLQQMAGLELVLRHYRRGGLVGRLLHDLYLRQPLPATRGLAELALLQRLRGWGLPVPRPAAARCVPAGGLYYRADILLQRLPGAEDLSQQLQRGPLPADAWRAVGAAIGGLHAAGVWHADLNCHNLMRDAEGRVWIIDFDRCAVRAPGPWRQDNLERLRRSLRKEAGRLAAWHWAEADWVALLEGYAAVSAPAGR